MKVLLDSNFVSEFIKDPALINPGVSAFITTLSPEKTFVSSISMAENFSGVETMPIGKRKSMLKAAYKEFYSEIALNTCLLSFTPVAAEEYALIKGWAKPNGISISVGDGMIAAIALVNDLTLVTNNVKDFAKIPNLNIHCPWL